MNWLYDEFARQWIVLYYWPYFVAGNIDDWLKLGNMWKTYRPMCFG